MCLRAWRACVLTCKRVLRTYVPTFQRAFHASVLTCQRVLHVSVLTSQHALHSYLFMCQRALYAFRVYVSTCSRVIITKSFQ